MTRAKPKPQPEPEPGLTEDQAAAVDAMVDEALAPDPTFAELWDQVEPGSRMSKGIYSIYKTEAGGLHIAYRPDGTDEDQHMPLPPAMVAMMIAASEGKGPLGRLRALATAQFGG